MPSKLAKKGSTKKTKKRTSSFKAAKGKAAKNKEENKLKVDQGESEMVVIGEITKPKKKPKKSDVKKRGEKMDIWLGLEYFFNLVGGLAAYVMKAANMKVEEKYMRNANEAIMFGVATLILAFIPIVGWIINIIALFYVAYMKANDENFEIPFVTKFTKEHFPYKG